MILHFVQTVLINVSRNILGGLKVMSSHVLSCFLFGRHLFIELLCASYYGEGWRTHEVQSLVAKADMQKTFLYNRLSSRPALA